MNKKFGNLHGPKNDFYIDVLIVMLLKRRLVAVKRIIKSFDEGKMHCEISLRKFVSF